VLIVITEEQCSAINASPLDQEDACRAEALDLSGLGSVPAHGDVAGYDDLVGYVARRIDVPTTLVAQSRVFTAFGIRSRMSLGPSRSIRNISTNRV
jgi:hypothetical protein